LRHIIISTTSRYLKIYNHIRLRICFGDAYKLIYLCSNIFIIFFGDGIHLSWGGSFHMPLEWLSCISCVRRKMDTRRCN
jgi:hypothetical protein